MPGEGCEGADEALGKELDRGHRPPPDSSVSDHLATSTDESALFLLASALLHLVVVALLEWLAPPDIERLNLRPAPMLYPRFPIERFKPRPAVPVSRQLLARVRGLGVPVPVAPEGEVTVPEALPPVEMPSTERAPVEIAGRDWEATRDTLPDSVLWRDQVTELPIPDRIELDAERRRRHVAIIDPETGKLQQGWLHLAVNIGNAGAVSP